MKTFMTLVKTGLNINFGFSALKYRFTKEKKKRWEPILIIASIILGLAPLIVMYSFMLSGLFTVGKAMNQPEIVLTIALVFGQVIILVFGIFYMMGAFYFSKDLSMLIPLPLRPYQVLGSKFVVVMVNECLTVLPILLPAIIIYGVGTKQGFFYWLKSIIIILEAPVIPLILDSVFVLIMMRLVNLRKNKDLFAIIGGFFGIFLAVGLNIFLQRIPEGMEQGMLENFLLGKQALIEAIGRKFPPSIWATYALAGTGGVGVINFVLFTALSVILFAALLWLANMIFYKSLMSGQEATGKKKVLSQSEIDRIYGRNKSSVMAILQREWKLLLRTPVYVLNGLVGAFVGPIMVVIMIFAQGNSSEMKELLAIISTPELALPVTLGGLAFMLFASGMNIVASTSLSREGSTFWISKMIPVSSGHQITAKLIHSVSVSAIGIFITGAILTLIFKLSIIRVIILIVLGCLGSIPLAATGLLIDVLRPKLEWNNPQEAVKQNINGVFGMLISMLIIGVLAVAGVALVLLKTPEWAVYAVLAVLMIIISGSSLMALYSVAGSRYGKIEV